MQASTASGAPFLLSYHFSSLTFSFSRSRRLTKRKYLRSELGEGTLQLIRTVKRALDPLNLLNPGKVLFDEGEEEGH